MRGGDQQGYELVDGGGTGLDGPGQVQDADRFDGSITGFGDRGGPPGDHRIGGGVGVQRVGLALGPALHRRRVEESAGLNILEGVPVKAVILPPSGPLGSTGSLPRRQSGAEILLRSLRSWGCVGWGVTDRWFTGSHAWELRRSNLALSAANLVILACGGCRFPGRLSGSGR